MDSINFGKGAVIDRVDNRDYQWKEIGFGAAPYDWSKTYDIEEKLGVKIPVKNQGVSSSCGGQAWAYYASVLEASDDKSYEERSAKYIYAQTYVPGGGSAGRTNCELFVKQGVSIEPLCISYEGGNPPSEQFITRGGDITTEARLNASLDKAFSYANVEKDIDTVAQAIEANKGLILGVWGENNGTWTSAFPKPPVNKVWAHWVYAGKVRMFNGVKQIGILNSWGKTVGESGWQWLSADYFPMGIFQVWTQVFSPNVVDPGFKHYFTQKLRYKDIGVEVKSLQTALQIDGTFPKIVAPTEYYGTITKKAVLDFQLKYQLADVQTLIGLKGESVGPLTLAQLNKLFNN